MFCPKCGTNLPKEAKFCEKCGFNIQAMQNTEPTQQVYAPSNEQVVVQPIVQEKNSGKKRKGKSFIIIILILVIAFFTVKLLMEKSNSSIGRSSYDFVSIVDNEFGIAKFIDGKFTNVRVKNESSAYEALDSLKDKLKFNDVKEEFDIESINKSEKVTYYRFHQKYKDVEVYGMNLVISVDKNGNALGMNGYYIPNINIDIDNKKSEEELKNIVIKDLGNNAQVYTSKKYVYADNNSSELVYIMNAHSSEEAKEYIINANTGEIISSQDSLEYAAYNFTGKGLDGNVDVIIEEYYDVRTLGNRYRLIDPTRNIEIADGSSLGADFAGIVTTAAFPTAMVGDLDGNNFKYLFDNEKNREIAQIGISTLKTFEEIYDYYKNVLDRDSYDGKGGKIIVNVGIKEKTFGSEKWENAAWLSLTNQMYIGYSNGKSFATVKDVLGHEITHGVISKTVGFAHSPKKSDKEKAFETGALNEGIADIMGSLIEGKNWTINEDIEIYRDLSNPNSYKNPAAKGGEFYYPDGYLNENRTLEQFLKDNNMTSVSDHDGGGEHHNATVPGHAAYLMYKNGAFTSMDEEAKLWYNSLFLMSSYSNFEDCALAVIKTAENLGYSDKSISIIEDAFIETNMLEERKIKLTGTVSDKKGPLKDATIELIKQGDKEKRTFELKTNEDGSFEKEIPIGTYQIIVNKEGYLQYGLVKAMYGDTKLDIKLSKDNRMECKSGDCRAINLYYIDDINDSGVEEAFETVYVDYGETIGLDVFVKTIKKKTGIKYKVEGKMLTTTTMGIKTKMGFYYKGTNELFDMDKPITEDVDLEMKSIMVFDDDDEDFSQVTIDSETIRDVKNFFEMFSN